MLEVMTLSAPGRVVQRWYSLRQAAIYTGTSASTLRRMVKAGRIRATKPIGVMVFDVSELDRFMLSRQEE